MENKYQDLLDSPLFDGIDQLDAGWEPLVSGPEDYLLSLETEDDNDTWESIAIAYEYLQQESAHAEFEDEQAEISDLLSLFA